MAARLPTVGGDDGNWGTILNTFLQVSHAGDGTLINNALGSKSANYTIALTDGIILADASGGSFALTLPTTVGNSGFRVAIKKTDSSSNAITIGTTSSQTIDGSTSIQIKVQYTTLELISDGSKWHII